MPHDGRTFFFNENPTPYRWKPDTILLPIFIVKTTHIKLLKHFIYISTEI